MDNVRLIDANALDLEPDKYNTMNGVRFCGRGGGRTVAMVQNALKHMIDNAPTIEAVPVVHAKWEIIHGMINPKYQGRKRCSRCGDISPSDMCCREMLTDYCPNCGARMDAKEE